MTSKKPNDKHWTRLPSTLWPGLLETHKESDDATLRDLYRAREALTGMAVAIHQGKELHLADKLKTPLAALSASRAAAFKLIQQRMPAVDAAHKRGREALEALQKHLAAEPANLARQSPFAAEVRARLAAAPDGMKRYKMVRDWIKSGDRESAAVAIGSPVALTGLDPKAELPELSKSFHSAFNGDALARREALENALDIVARGGSHVVELPGKLHASPELVAAEAHAAKVAEHTAAMTTSGEAG